MDSSGAHWIWFGVPLVAARIGGRWPLLQPQHGRFARQFFVPTSEHAQGFFHHASCGWDPFGSAKGRHAQPSQHQGHPHTRQRFSPGASVHCKRRVASCFVAKRARIPSFARKPVSKSIRLRTTPRRNRRGDPDPADPTLRQSRHPNGRRVCRSFGNPDGSGPGWRRRCKLDPWTKVMASGAFQVWKPALAHVHDHGDATKRGMEPRQRSVDNPTRGWRGKGRGMWSCGRLNSRRRAWTMSMWYAGSSRQ